MSKKRYDRNGRIRNKVVAFRMSEEENQMLDRKVALSGLTKQDYIIGCILDKEITVYGNPYVFRSLHNVHRCSCNNQFPHFSSNGNRAFLWLFTVDTNYKIFI